MNHHQEAWQHVEPQLFGTVCEVTRKKPWGFYKDRPSIINKTVQEFLSEDTRYDTILLHILSGEGESINNIKAIFNKALSRAVKVVILEHNPTSLDFKNLKDIKTTLELWLNSIGEKYIFENWERNLLYAFTTLNPLHIPQLSDQYLKDNLDKSYISEKDHGICKNNLIYTHTSESLIDFELPIGEYYWVIGGGIPYEAMQKESINILIDSTLKQVLYTGRQYGVEEWKLDRIWKPEPIAEDKNNWLPHWRKVKKNRVKPESIQHLSLDQLDVKNRIVYVSTVHKDHWKHLIKGNTILDAWTPPRDKIKILK